MSALSLRLPSVYVTAEVLKVLMTPVTVRCFVYQPFVCVRGGEASNLYNTSGLEFQHQVQEKDTFPWKVSVLIDFTCAHTQAHTVQ